MDESWSRGLATHLGLDKYRYIIQYQGDVSKDTKGFQRIFNGYYNVRRNEAWRIRYYDVFEQVRAKELGCSFESILRAISEGKTGVEPSFSSKMLATIDPKKPIWDSRVLSALSRRGHEIPHPTACDYSQRIDEAITSYKAIEAACCTLLQDDAIKRSLAQFDVLFPDYSWITLEKKLDFLLWCEG